MCYFSFLRLVQSSTSTGAFYISNVDEDRVVKVNANFGTKMVVGSPIKFAVVHMNTRFWIMDTA